MDFKRISAIIDYPPALLYKPDFPYQKVVNKRYDFTVPIVAKWLQEWSSNPIFMQYGTIDNAIIRASDNYIKPSNIDMDWYNGCLKTIVTTASRAQLLPLLYNCTHIGLAARRGLTEYNAYFSERTGTNIYDYQHINVLGAAYSSRIASLIKDNKLTKSNVIKCLSEDAPNPPAKLVSLIISEKGWSDANLDNKSARSVIKWASSMTKDSPAVKQIQDKYLGSIGTSQRACYTRWVYIFQKEVSDKTKYSSLEECLNVTTYIKDSDRQMFKSIQKNDQYKDKPHLVYKFLARNAPWFKPEFVVRLEVGILDTIHSLINILPPITKPFYVYRGMEDDGSYLAKQSGELISTSVVTRFPFLYSYGETVARIKLSKGIRALPILGIGAYYIEEAEIALSPDTKYMQSKVVGKKFCDNAATNTKISHSRCTAEFRKFSEWIASPLKIDVV